LYTEALIGLDRLVTCLRLLAFLNSTTGTALPGGSSHIENSAAGGCRRSRLRAAAGRFLDLLESAAELVLSIPDI